MYDIVIYKRKLNKVKVIVCALVVTSLVSAVTVCVLRCVHYAKEDAYTQVVFASAEALTQQEQWQEEQNQIAAAAQQEEEAQKKSVTPEQVDQLFNTDQKVVYLTFDDGPSSLTPSILDILQTEQVKATFFMLGTRVEQNPDTVKRMYQEGHYLANHGYSHQYSTIYTNPQTVLDEYNRTEQAIQNALQNPYFASHLFRFPGGSHDGYYHTIKQEAKQLLRQNGVASLDWNALTRDAEGANTVEAVMQNLYETAGTKGQIVVLMHDAGDKTQTYEALPLIIRHFRNNGYTFCNMYDLIQ